MSWEVWTMKSKMSFFDPTLLKKNVGRFAPAWALLTLALFLGTLPSMMSAAGWIPAGSFTLLPALSLLSAALMALGLSLFSRRRGDGA